MPGDRPHQRGMRVPARTGFGQVGERRLVGVALERAMQALGEVHGALGQWVEVDEA